MSEIGPKMNEPKSVMKVAVHPKNIKNPKVLSPSLDLKNLSLICENNKPLIPKEALVIPRLRPWHDLKLYAYDYHTFKTNIHKFSVSKLSYLRIKSTKT